MLCEFLILHTHFKLKLFPLDPEDFFTKWKKSINFTVKLKKLLDYLMINIFEIIYN